MHAILNTFLFLLATGILLFLPGWIVLRLFFQKNHFVFLESFVLSFGISIGLIDFLMIALGKSNTRLDIFSIGLGIFFCLGILSLIAWLNNRKKKNIEGGSIEERETFAFNNRQSFLFLLLLGLTLFIKVIYLTNAVLPTSTDLGHHMYWAKLIATTGTLPLYAKQEIITDANDVYQLTNPRPIADFIIGEHLPFVAINMFVGLDFFSAFPVIFLLLVNVLSLLASFLFALRFASSIASPFLSERVFTPQNVALATLFFFGPLYTLASPEAKFVSGGVVGNTLGNFFIPLILLILFRALKEKRSGFLALAFFLIFTLAYTHHLSMLMFLFILITSILISCVAHYDTIGTLFRSWYRLVLSPAPLLVTFFCITFFFAIALPTYIETNAVGTALGTPTKTTRTGLSFPQISSSSGSARVAIGIVGFFLLLLLRKYKRYAGAFLIGWFGILFIMASHPEWLFIDIPSNRIITYFSFPLGLLTAFAIIAFFATLKNGPSRFRIPSILILLIGLTVFVFSAGDGSLDNNQTILPQSKALGAIQTFSASHYLASNSTQEDVILKDHNYIVADSWMKLFFLRDYAFPLSRGFFKRYEDNPSREQCTLWMISIPNTENGKKCYDDLSVRFVLINPHLDTTQFEKSQQFSRIYVSDDIHIYERKN
ncbi:MAG: hypothetical protein AUK19_03635 [Candidatus Moranbacteria bacterium CG2_30_45_14]|nr:MAG: hypothetical protein AUK19_03635 [Candidatus Moranbacteria bacterium CG2_30_45_14]